MRRAFTLVELSVVVFIVGLLIGLLTPALAGVALSARRAQCLANLHGFGTPIRLYMDIQNDGVLPVAPGYDPRFQNASYTQFYDVIADYLDVSLPRADASGGFTSYPPFRCPRDREFAPLHGFSYSYHAGLLMAPVWDPTPDPRRARKVTFLYEAWPTHSMVLIDGGNWHPGGPWHRRINALYFDGSADWGRADPRHTPPPATEVARSPALSHGGP